MAEVDRTARDVAVVFELQGVGVVQTDLKTGRFRRANATFCKLLGYSEAELQELTYLDLTHPDDRARDAASFEALRQGEQLAGTSVTRCLCKDGAVVWLELHVNILDSEGDDRVNLTVVYDITERKRAEAERERLLKELKVLNETLEQRVEERTEALRRSEQRFSQAFHAIPVATCITSLGRETFLEVNDSFLELTGYTREAVLGKDVFELDMWSSPEDQEKLGQQMGSFRNLELHLRTRTGALRTILVSREFIQLNAQVQGQLKLFYDVTERKRSEEELYQAIQEVMSDTAWFSQQVLERLAHIRAGRPEAKPSVELTLRERQILTQLAQGKSNEAIAADLGLAQQTVRNYISTVYDKLGVKSRVEAVVWARERGIT